MRRASDGKWTGESICLKKKFFCHNYIQCADGKDEEHCEDEYLRKRTFPRDYNYVCRSVSLVQRSPSLIVSCPTRLYFNRNVHLFIISNIITADIAVLLMIITFFSTPIITKILGDGSVEVREITQNTKTQKEIVDRLK